MAAPLTSIDRNTIKTIHQSKSGQLGLLISLGHLHCLHLVCRNNVFRHTCIGNRAKVKTRSKILRGPKSIRKNNKTAMEIYSSFTKLNLIQYIHIGWSLIIVTLDLQPN